MFESNDSKASYDRILGRLSQRIAIAINNGTDFTEFPATTAFVSRYTESDLITGGSIQLGDVKIILLPADLPAGVTSLGLKDRIIIDNRNYAVIHWDNYSRKVGSDPVAIEIAVRGGGVYTGDVINDAPAIGGQSVSPRFAAMYERFMGPLSQEVFIARNTGTAFDVSAPTKAYVSKYKETDLVAGGSVELGDLKIIIQQADMPAGIDSLELADRIVIDNYYYAVTHWDDYTRKIGDQPMAVEVTVRGRGTYFVPEEFSMITENGEPMITEDALFTMITQGGAL
jgi:hypothetical protein